MSRQTMDDVFAPVMAKYRADVAAATWGHLAPEKNKKYEGYVVFAIPVYESGSPCIVFASFKGLSDSPWLYEAMCDLASQQEKAGVYRFKGTLCNYTFEGSVFRIKTKPSSRTDVSLATETPAS
jgi:hypothetical protein